ncbi:glycosyltransferase family 4 protein, partial [Candidatus Margulisiibacteriota bacterium]
MKVLIINMARNLLREDSVDTNEEIIRMKTYAEGTEGLFIIVHSLKKHKLAEYKNYGKLQVFATNAASRIRSFFKIYALASQLIEKHKIDIVQSQDILLTGLLGIFLRKKYKIKLITCMYGSNIFNKDWQDQHWANRLLYFVGKNNLKKTDMIMLDSTQNRDSLIKRGIPKEKIYLKPVVPNDIGNFDKDKLDQEKLAKKKKELGISSEALVCLYAGGLIPSKNISGLLHIFADTMKILPDKKLHLIILGQGKLKEKLISLCNELNISSQVTFSNFLPRQDVPYIYGLSDIFVFFSNTEGFARVLMEAGHIGLPIVTTDVSGARDIIIPEENGYIVPVKDSAAFKQ